MQHTNRLAQETSPYLLQHAHNPVDWFPWGEEAFQKARAEDKPILVSIGYAACHWCHVMERESFEDEQTAALMNAHFVNIKVDREERPDVDHIYMDAVQAISGSGGWPLNVFLTPDGKPFYGGTYFPPRQAFNRASWTEVLLAIAQTYKEGREKILKDAETLTQHLQQSNAFGAVGKGSATVTASKLEGAYKAIMKQADKEWGGFGAAPKFPQTFTLTFLLRFSHLTQNNEAKEQALLSLAKMAQGGIYDQVGGGFARYSTDREWLAPHFEKMLYDNALLVQTYAEAYQLSGNEQFKEVIRETLRFAERELLHPDGGFYSALDADSEGEEGKFYVWAFEKVQELLGEDAGLFCQYYNITPEGNWEGKNILFVKTPLNEFANEQGIDMGFLKSLLRRGKEALLQERNTRIRPGLDDKILLGWNALMNVAYSRAYAATGHEEYKKKALRNMNFLLEHFKAQSNTLYHTWKEGRGKVPAFLDDYSYLIAALIELGQVTGDAQWLTKAACFTKMVLEGFSDAGTPLFYFTHLSQTDILIRKKEVYDGATPSGNAVMAQNLFQMSMLLDKPEWRERAEAMLAAMGEVALKYPTSFGVWLGLLLQMVYGTKEVAIVGEKWEAYLNEVLRVYLPHKLVMASGEALPEFPLLRGRKEDAETRIYLCQNYACRQPVTTPESFRELVASNN
jgi:uncharacterized protein YyaL (SSP411 family)